MRLMTYNILDGGEGRIDPIAEAIRQGGADIAVLQETTDRSLLTRLANRLTMDFFLANGPAGKGAVAVLSRWEIAHALNLTLLEPRFTRAALRASIATPEGMVHLLGVHLHARETLADEAVRVSEVAGLLSAAEAFRAELAPDAPLAILGDFNASHPQQTIDLAALAPRRRQRIAEQGNVVPRDAIAHMLAAGYLDAHALCHTPENFQASFTTANPAARVDYIFVPPHLARSVKRCDVLPMPIARFASDHYPVVADLAFESVV